MTDAKDSQTEVLNKIKAVILKTVSGSGLKIVKIILFGSRASGNNDPLSDYDLLILITKTISMSEKMDISSSIRKKLADERIDADVVIKSAEEADVHKHYVGTIVREALKEGVAI